MDALAFELVLVIERLLETAAADHPLDDIWTKKARTAARLDAEEVIARARATIDAPRQNTADPEGSA